MSARPSILLAIVALTSFVAKPASAQDYSFERYGELEAEMIAADEARASAEPETDEWEELSTQAIDARQELATYLHEWIDTGDLDADTADYAERARLLLYENLVHLYVDSEDCDAARDALDQLSALDDSADAELASAYVSAARAALGCDVTVVVATVEPVEAGTDPGMTERPERRSNAAGIALIGGGTALVATAAVWNFTLLDERNEHRDSNGCLGDCAVRVAELGDQIDSAKVPIAILFSAGLASAAIGSVMVLTRGADDEPQTTVQLGAGWAGVELRGRVFGGAR